MEIRNTILFLSIFLIGCSSHEASLVSISFSSNACEQNRGICTA
jgi:hypothetical protein